MSDEWKASMSVPLDSDGFLRRECPTCEKEFKWLPTQDGETDDEARTEGTEETKPAEGGYFCPYCAVQAPTNAWLTKAQAEKAQSVLYEEFIEPELEGFKRNVERGNRQSSGGLIGIRTNVEIDEPDEPLELTETDDMKRVDFACHPGEPVKVLDDWTGSVHCLVCGEAVEV